MKLHFKKEYDGNPESLPGRSHMPGAVKFKEWENTTQMSIFANLVSIGIIAVLAGVMIWRSGGFHFSYLGCICSLLVLFPHEMLHAVCFKEDVYLYTCWKRGMLFVVGTETMSKGRFVFLSLLPNLVFGVLPFLIFLVWPEQIFFGTLGLLSLSMGSGDYYNVFNALTQMPKGARTYLNQFSSYWYMPQEEKKGIIFDMDGTLWDSSAEVAESWSHVVAEKYTPDRVITEEDLRRVMGKTMDLLAAALFPELPEERRMALLEECCQAENEYLRKHGGRLYPGLEETVKELAGKYSLYIVSNCQSGYIEAFLAYYQMEPYFADTECYGNNGLDKSENIRKVVERNHLTDAVYVGDIQGDYEASRKAGVKFIHAAYGFGDIEQEVPEIHALPQLKELAAEVL